MSEPAIPWLLRYALRPDGRRYLRTMRSVHPRPLRAPSSPSLGPGLTKVRQSGSSAKKRRGRPPAAPDPNNRKKGWTCSRCLQSMQHDNKRRHLLKLSVVSAGGVRTTGEFCIIKDKATIKRLQEQGKRNNTNADRFAISVCLPLAYHPSTTTNIMRPPRPPLLFRGAAHADRCPFLSIRPCTNRNANCVSPPLTHNAGPKAEAALC